MKQVDTMPTSGQFVAVWCVASGQPFSATIDIVSGDGLYSYEAIEDSWECENGYSREFFEKVGAIYFVKSEGEEK